LEISQVLKRYKVCGRIARPLGGRHLGHRRNALPGDPPGELEVVEGVPDGGRIPDLNGSGHINRAVGAREPKRHRAAREWNWWAPALRCTTYGRVARLFVLVR
jgi:hypothetical protein